MALINCPECNQEVSNLATECPKCAYPISGGGTTQASGGKVQTVEQTGKIYKLNKILSALFICVGICVVVVGFQTGSRPSIGIAMVAIGFIWFCITSFLSWWHHG